MSALENRSLGGTILHIQDAKPSLFWVTDEALKTHYLQTAFYGVKCVLKSSKKLKQPWWGCLPDYTQCDSFSVFAVFHLKTDKKPFQISSTTFVLLQVPSDWLKSKGHGLNWSLISGSLKCQWGKAFCEWKIHFKLDLCICSIIEKPEPFFSCKASSVLCSLFDLSAVQIEWYLHRFPLTMDVCGKDNL